MPVDRGRILLVTGTATRGQAPSSDATDRPPPPGGAPTSSGAGTIGL